MERELDMGECRVYAIGMRRESVLFRISGFSGIVIFYRYTRKTLRRSSEFNNLSYDLSCAVFLRIESATKGADILGRL